MKKLLVLMRGESATFNDLHGNSILADLPVPVVVLADRTNAHHFEGLGPEVEFVPVRYSDLEGIRRQARRLHECDGLLGIAVVDEKIVELAAELRQELGLPGMHTDDALRFRNKLVMKQLLAAGGMRVPAYAGCEDREAVYALQRRYGRLVLKPADGLGSREVEFIASVAELDAWYAAQNRVDGFEAEEFVDGVLHHINAVVRDGEVLLTASAPYLPGMANIDFSSGAPFVSVLLVEGELKQRLERFSNQALAILGMRDGVTHMECFVKDDGEIVFCEVGARPGGGGIVLMMEAQYGVNYARAVMLLEAGRGDLLAFDAQRHAGVTGLMGFRHATAGFVQRIAHPTAFNEDWIHHVNIDLDIGGFISPASHCTDYIGLLVFSAQDHADFESNRSQLYDRFYSALETQPI
jgi:biotin carboxylase